MFSIVAASGILTVVLVGCERIIHVGLLSGPYYPTGNPVRRECWHLLFLFSPFPLFSGLSATSPGRQ